MNFARICTGILFLVVSLGIQILNWWLLSRALEGKDDWLIIPVIIFLWNVITPVVFVYRLLLERGILFYYGRFKRDRGRNVECQ